MDFPTSRLRRFSARNHRISFVAAFRIARGGRLGFYGFGAAAHVAIQVARHWGVEVFASTRDARHQKLALELGAAWAGGTFDEPPKKLDAAIVFAPAGEIVPAALKALKKGGVLVLGGIHMSPIPSFDYELLYQERMIRSVANNTRKDGEDFLHVAAENSHSYSRTDFSLSDANRALNALKNDASRGLPCCALTMDSQREVEEDAILPGDFGRSSPGEISDSSERIAWRQFHSLTLQQRGRRRRER